MVNIQEPLDRVRELGLEFGFVPVFGAAIAMFVVSPALSDSDAGSAVLNLLAFGVLLGAIRATDVQGWPRRIAVGLTVFGCLMLGLQVVTDASVFIGARALTLMGLWVATVSWVLAQVLLKRRVTVNTVFGALTVYFLLALLFGFAYAMIEDVNGGSFAFAGPAQEDPTDELLYYSLVTQTTLGLGDITPVGAIPRTLTAVQAVIGQVYLVVLIARLVAMQLVQDQEADERS